MPITRPGASPIDSARSELQIILSNYGTDLLEQLVNEMGLSKVESSNDKKREATLEEAIQYYLTSSYFLHLSSSSKKTYKSELSQFKSFINKEYGENITLQDSAEPMLLVKYLHPFNSNTKVKKSAFLRSFYRCVLKQFLNQDISDIKDVLKIKWTNDHLPRAFSKAQLAEIICLAQMSRNDLRNYTMIWVFLGSGIRLGGLVNLQIKDIEANTQTIKIISKGHEENKIPAKISRIALLILQDYIKFKYDYHKKNLTEDEYKNLYIFSTDNGYSPINPRTVQYMIKDLINKAISIPQNEKKRFSVHSLRHSFSVFGLEAGIDIYTLSKLLNHKSINSTTVYLKLFDDQLQKAIEKHPFAQEEKLKLQKRISDEL